MINNEGGHYLLKQHHQNLLDNRESLQAAEHTNKLFEEVIRELSGVNHNASNGE